MHLVGKEWKKVPLLLDELKGLFEELTDEELDYCKKIAIEEEKKVLRSLSKPRKGTNRYKH